MQTLEKNTRVHVPAKSVGLGDDYPSAMVECNFVRMSGYRSVVDDVPNTHGERQLDRRLVTRKLGILILQLGDFDTEDYLLEPSFRALSHISSLVLLPEYVWARRVRSLEEMETFWERSIGVVSHLVLVGHGGKASLTFGRKSVGVDEFCSVLGRDSVDGEAPLVISLCCKSGSGLFGKEVSGNPTCRAFIGPSGAIHAANSALFYQSFLSHSLVDGRTIEKAYQLARVFTPGVTEFNMWQKTKLVHKPSRRELLDNPS
jgi:hypothetical protein